MDDFSENSWGLDSEKNPDKEKRENASKNLIKMKTMSNSSSDSGISDATTLRKPTVGFIDQEDQEEPGQTISSAMRRGEFKPTSRKKSQWGQYLLNVDMKKVMASGTFKLTLLQLARDGESETLGFFLKTLSKSQCRRMLNSTTDEEGVTALHLAAKNNHYNVCKQLIDAGASVGIRTGDTRATPLHFAARIRPKKRPLVTIAEEEIYGSNIYQKIAEPQAQSTFDRKTSVILLLHENGANVNDADIEGQTPLHCATIKGNMPCVEQLIQCQGVNVDIKDGQGMTALHLAAAHGYKEIVHALIQSGASLHATDNDSMTPLHFACADGNVNVVRLIVNCASRRDSGQVKEMLRRVDGEKSTALHIAVGKGHTDVVVELLGLLSSEDASDMVSLTRSHNDTPLHIAASQGFLDICDKLIYCGATVDARNDSLATPLLLAAHHNNYEIVEFLHQRGADVETRDKDNLTPLLLACKQGHLETLSWLIEHEADCNATEKNDKTCLMLAVDEQRTAAVHELLKYDSILRLMDETDKNANCVLHIAAKKGFLPIIKVLLDHGAYIDSKNEDEETALHVAARFGQHVTLKELLDHDKTTINAVDENACTALHSAAIQGHTKCVVALIDHGANVALRNTRQMTALDCACSRGREATASALLQAQAVVNPTKGSRTTPLHEACIHGHPQVARLLLDWRADVTAKLADGRNPLDCAIDQDQMDCVQAILEHESWKHSLRNAYVDPVTETVVTPARKLIMKMPEMAEFAFTRSIESNRKKWDDKNLEVTLDFEFLDDMYTVTQWLHADDDGFEKKPATANGNLLNGDTMAGVELKQKPSMKKRNVSLPDDLSSYEAFNDRGKLNSNAITYTEDTNVLRHNHPLMIMVSRKREVLLRHPVVTALLQYKWNKYGGFVYYSSLAFLMLFVILLNCYMLLIPPPYTVDFLRSLANRRFYAEFTDGHLKNYTDPRECYNVLEDGAVYRGRIGVSASNLTCIDWSSTSTDEKLYPDAGLEKNYCRNPGLLRDRPWCFTNYSEYRPEDIVREECDVPRCPVYLTRTSLPRGSTCHFPFVYRNTTYAKCIPFSSGDWCSATENFDIDRKGGYCSDVDPYCVMPNLVAKRPCGKPGTDQRNCEARGCCYAVHNEGLPTEYSECHQKLNKCHDQSDICPLLAKSSGCDVGFMIWGCPLTCKICNVTKESDDNGARRRFLYLMSTYPDETFHPEWGDGCYFCLPGAAKKWGTECRHKGAWEDPVKIFLLVICVFNLLRLLLQIWNYRLEAFKPIFFLELGLYVLCMLLVIDLYGFDLEITDEMKHELHLYEPLVEKFQKETGLRMNWQWQCGVMALFLSWMNLLLYIQKIPYLGIYVVMFNDIFKTFTKFSVVFLLFILSFAFTFHALLQNEIEFEFPFQSVLKATVMMVGELDFTGIFLGGSEEYEKKVNYLILTYLLFAIFIVVMMIIIMNLLVGLAVGDIMEVQQHATLERLKMQVELALEVEFAVPNIIRKRFVRKSAVINPNRYRGRNALTRAIFEDKNLSTKNLASVVATGKSESEEMQESMQQLVSVTRELRTKINDLETLVKETLAETKETKSAVDENADVQQQKITLDDEAKAVPGHGLKPSQRSRSWQSLHSPVPVHSLIPAFMRSASFRRDNRSSGRRHRSSLRGFRYRSSEAVHDDGAEVPLIQSMESGEGDAVDVVTRSSSYLNSPVSMDEKTSSETSPLSVSGLSLPEVNSKIESDA